MLILALFLVIVAFVVFSLFGFLKQSKVIDFAWGLSYTDSSLIGQVNELLKRELSVGLVKLTVSEKNLEWNFCRYFVTSPSAVYEIWWFWFELVREFLNIFEFLNNSTLSWSLFYWNTWFGPEFLRISGPGLARDRDQFFLNPSTIDFRSNILDW